LRSLNDELLLKVFLDGDIQPGKKDFEIYEKIKTQQIDSDKLPNLFRWKSFMQKFSAGKTEEKKDNQ